MDNSVTMAAAANWAPGWSMISALAVLVAIVAVFYAIRHFRFEVWLRAEELFRSFHQDRARIFARFPTCVTPWTEEDKAHAREVSRKMNTVAYLLNFLPKGEVLEHWDDSLGKAWDLLKPIVLEERNHARWNSKWKHFEVWGERARDKLIREKRDPRRQEAG